MATRSSRLDLDWAADLEVLASSMSAGLSLEQSLALLSQRASLSWNQAFTELSTSVESEASIQLALTKCKLRERDHRFDFLCEILSAQRFFGGNGLVDVISRTAQNHRHAASANEDVQSRVKAIVSVSRLGVLSPWVMVVLLATRQENLTAYFSATGSMVLFLGLAVCSFATWLIHRGARFEPAPRSLAS